MNTPVTATTPKLPTPISTHALRNSERFMCFVNTPEVARNENSVQSPRPTSASSTGSTSDAANARAADGAATASSVGGSTVAASADMRGLAGAGSLAVTIGPAAGRR